MLIQYLKSFIEVITINIIEFLKSYWNTKVDNIEEFPVYNNEIQTALARFKPKYSEILDSNYMTSSLEKLKGMLALIPVKMQKYSAEHDCDNFAFEYMGIAKRMFPLLPVGYCHVKTAKGYHALNFLLYKERDGGMINFTFIEPQTNKISNFDYKPYLMIL